MKDFASWVSDMAGSIEDESEFLKENSKIVYKELSELQVRLRFANINIISEDLPTDWVSCFCGTFSLQTVIGPETYDAYINTSHNELFVDTLKRLINNGKTVDEIETFFKIQW